jgi:hypothetical protein
MGQITCHCVVHDAPFGGVPCTVDGRRPAGHVFLSLKNQGLYGRLWTLLGILPSGRG